MIYTNRPAEFYPKFEVVCCHVDYKDTFLLLLRNDNKSAGGKWGMPAGKIDIGEDERTAVKRETYEETGLDIPTDRITYRTTVYVRYPDYDFTYHIFQTKLDSKRVITINPEEHKDFRFVTAQEALALGADLVPDEDLCIKLIYGDVENREE